MRNITGDWKFSFSTPAQESLKWGGRCGGFSNVYVPNGEMIMGRPSTDTICWLPYWRDDAENENMLNIVRLISSAPDLLKAVTEVNKHRGSLPQEVIDLIDKALTKVDGNPLNE